MTSAWRASALVLVCAGALVAANALPHSFARWPRTNKLRHRRATERAARDTVVRRVTRSRPPICCRGVMARNHRANVASSVAAADEPMGPPGTRARMTRVPAEWQGVLQFYLAHSPDRLPAPSPWPPGRCFRLQHARFRAAQRSARAGDIACEVRRRQRRRTARPARNRDAARGYPGRQPRRSTAGVLPRSPASANPAHIEMFDVDRDGQQDFLVADLGGFVPGDHSKRRGGTDARLAHGRATSS